MAQMQIGDIDLPVSAPLQVTSRYHNKLNMSAHLNSDSVATVMSMDMYK